MSKARHITSLVAALVAACSAIASPSLARDNIECFPDWRAAHQIIAREGLATVEDLTQSAQSAGKGGIIRTVLCRQSETFVYRIVVRAPSGRLTTETVNARQPFGARPKSR